MVLASLKLGTDSLSWQLGTPGHRWAPPAKANGHGADGRQSQQQGEAVHGANYTPGAVWCFCFVDVWLGKNEKKENWMETNFEME